MPSTVSNVRVTSVKSTEISLAWDAPSDPYSDIEMYEVRNRVEHCKVNRNLQFWTFQNYVQYYHTPINPISYIIRSGIMSETSITTPPVFSQRRKNHHLSPWDKELIMVFKFEPRQHMVGANTPRPFTRGQDNSWELVRQTM